VLNAVFSLLGRAGAAPSNDGSPEVGE